MANRFLKGTTVHILNDKWNATLQKAIDNGQIATGVVNWSDRKIASVVSIELDGEPFYHSRPGLEGVAYVWQSSMENLAEISTCIKP